MKLFTLCICLYVSLALGNCVAHFSMFSQVLQTKQSADESLIKIIINFREIENGLNKLHQKSKTHITLLLHLVLLNTIINQLPSPGDIGCKNVCLFSSIMGVNGALNVVLTVPKTYI